MKNLGKDPRLLNRRVLREKRLRMKERLIIRESKNNYRFYMCFFETIIRRCKISFVQDYKNSISMLLIWN